MQKFLLDLPGQVALTVIAMTNQENLPEFKEHRVNIALTKEAALDIERLRCKLELELKQRLSLAQVMKRLVKQALAD